MYKFKSLSCVLEQKFNRKSASSLLNALELAEGRDIEISPLTNIKTIKSRDKDAMTSFIKKTVIEDGN